MIVTTREQRKRLDRENAKQSLSLREIPCEDWPDDSSMRKRVLRSRHWLVQVFDAPSPALARLSVNRTTMSGDRWADGISWDELQGLKNECGYADHDAVEIFPAADDVVNVANMRHLWVMRVQLSFAWRKP